MSLQYIIKNITSVTSGVVAHGTNTLGVMGSGAALYIKNKWPKAFVEYAKLCAKHDSYTGELLGVTQTVEITPSLYVANCFTQAQFGRDGKAYAQLPAIEESVAGAIAFSKFVNLPLYLPKIGGGLGGLDFDKDVRPVIEQLSEDEPTVDIFVCDLA